MLFISSYDRLRTILNRFVEAQIPVCVWGHRAIGKSQLVHSLATDYARDTGGWKAGELPCLADVRLAGYDPADLMGMPARNEGELRTRFLPPDTMPIGDNASDLFFGFGVLFADELNRAESAVVNAVFQLLTDRRIGRHELLFGWSIIIAANPTQGYDVNTFDQALITRMGHIVFSPAHPEATLEWAEWASTQGFESSYIHFLSENWDLLWGGDDEGENWDELLGFKVGPNPRSNAMVGRLFQVAHDMDERRDLMTACVGQEATIRYLSFSPRYNVQAILNGDAPPSDLTHSEVLGLRVPLSMVKPSKGRASKVCNFLEMLVGHRDGLDIEAPDIAVAILKDMVRKDSGWAPLISTYMRQFLSQIV